MFSRLDDMFEFFRADRTSAAREGLAINPGYWGEKLQAADRADGFKSFDLAQFKTAMRDEITSFLKDCGWPRAQRRMLLDEVQLRILRAEDEYEAVQGLRDFSFDGAPGLFTDFFSQDLERYSDRFLWCCYAVAWGVQKYDRARQRVDRPVPAEPQEQRPRERA